MNKKRIRIEFLDGEHGISFVPLIANRDLSRLGIGERNVGETTDPGLIECEQANQQGRGEESQGTGEESSCLSSEDSWWGSA